MWLNLIIPPNPTWELFVLTASRGAPLEGATVPRSNPKLEPQEREVDGWGHSLLVFLLQISVTFPHNYRMKSWVSAKWSQDPLNTYRTSSGVSPGRLRCQTQRNTLLALLKGGLMQSGKDGCNCPPSWHGSKKYGAKPNKCKRKRQSYQILSTNNNFPKNSEDCRQPLKLCKWLCKCLNSFKLS